MLSTERELWDTVGDSKTMLMEIVALRPILFQYYGRKKKMAGRRPIPTEIKKLRGNPGHRPIVGDDVQPEVEVPEMPDGLSRVAKREFRFMCRALLNLGVLTVVDGRALADYCEAFEQKQKALKELNRLGAAIETYGINKEGERVFLGIKKNPWWSVYVDACKLEKAFLIEFGLTPASRRNLKVSPPMLPPDIEMARILNRRGDWPQSSSLDISSIPDVDWPGEDKPTQPEDSEGTTAAPDKSKQ